MKHKIGVLHLIMIGASGAIGSGWLFSSMYAAHFAGSGAYFAWIIGALMMFLFCLCLSELVSLYPERGLLASVCSFSHNKDFAFIIGIANWFGTVAVIPTESLATARYLSWPHWTIFALILGYAALNTWGVKLFARFNTSLTAFKIAVPVVTVVVLFWHSHSTINYHVNDFTNTHHILAAVIAGGIIYGFNGVQMLVNFTSEVKRPRFQVPLALFVTLAIVLVLYLGLQAAFLNSAKLNINYQSPFVELVAAMGLGWMVILLQAGAAVSPSGTGFIYIASSTRMLTSMSSVGSLPKFFSKLHPKYHISHRSLIANTVLSLMFFLVFKTWVGLVVVVSSFHLISYIAGPIAVGKLRITMPKHERIFKTPIAFILCPLLFAVISVLFATGGTHNDIIITLIALFFQLIYLVSHYIKAGFWKAVVRSSFIPLWLIIFSALTYFHVPLVAVAVVALGFYYAGTRAY